MQDNEQQITQEATSLPVEPSNKRPFNAGDKDLIREALAQVINLRMMREDLIKKFNQEDANIEQAFVGLHKQFDDAGLEFMDVINYVSATMFNTSQNFDFIKELVLHDEINTAVSRNPE